MAGRGNVSTTRAWQGDSRATASFFRKVGNAMAFQRVPNTAEVTILYLQNNEPMANVFHAELSTGYDFADIAALAAAVDGAMFSHLRPVMSTQCAYVRTEVRGLDVENDLFDTDDAQAGIGAITGSGLPNNVTLSIKKESGFTGRSARGRWYFTGMPESYLMVNENTVDPTDVVAMVTAVENLRAVVQATAWSPVIVSRRTEGAARTVGITFPWISVVAVNDFVDTQRRRLTV